MARYSLYVLKVPLNTKQTNKLYPAYFGTVPESRTKSLPYSVICHAEQLCRSSVRGLASPRSAIYLKFLLVSKFKSLFSVVLTKVLLKAPCSTAAGFIPDTVTATI